MVQDKSSPNPSKIEVAWVRRMLAGVLALGEPAQDYLMEAGISSTLLRHPGSTVNANQLAILYRVLVERRKDEGLGFFPGGLKYGGFALTTNYALGAHTLGQAIRRAARALQLQQDHFTLTMHREDENVATALALSSEARASHPFLQEMLIWVYARFFSWLVGGRLPILYFCFTHARPASPHNYASIFPAPARFERGQSAFLLKASWLHAPVRRDKVALRHFLAQAHANVVSPSRFDQAIVVRVRQQLQFGQPMWGSLKDVADALHMSTATLQRRLAREHTSFQQLKDELRRDNAIAKLSTSKVAMDVLATEFGFADTTAFTRAFKSWTGRTPGSYREGGVPID